MYRLLNKNNISDTNDGFEEQEFRTAADVERTLANTVEKMELMLGPDRIRRPRKDMGASLNLQGLGTGVCTCRWMRTSNNPTMKCQPS